MVGENSGRSKLNLYLDLKKYINIYYAMNKTDSSWLNLKYI